MNYDNFMSMEVYKQKVESFIIDGETWGIYGTGNGATLVVQALRETKLLHNVGYVFDRDEVIGNRKEFQSLPVVKLSECLSKLDGIIVAAIDNGQVIVDRINDLLSDDVKGKIKIIDFFRYNSEQDYFEYAKYLEATIKRESPEFEEMDSEEFVYQKGDTKVIAWYLPQFHQLEINNRFHGMGFTEWTNTSRAIPMFTGHYQPHIPYDVGYYDLNNIETLKRQAYLAKRSGIYGFCYHYYWFSGTRIMEKPLEMLLEHEEIDLPFCINWATENWTALWDGGSSEVMLEQKWLEEDWPKFMQDILPVFKDDRYIKINNMPLLVIYRVDLLSKEKAREMFYSFRNYAKQAGYDDLFIMITGSFNFDEDVETWGADAFVEYPPFGLYNYMESWRPFGYLNPLFKGSIYDVSLLIKKKAYLQSHQSKRFFRSVLTSWDNTARKAMTNAAIFTGLTPMTFKIWLKDVVEESKRIHSAEEDFVFVNSWNEWAEGSHLEPDYKYGYAWLNRVKEVIIDNRRK